MYNGAKSQSVARLESTAPIKNDNLNQKQTNLLNTEIRYNNINEKKMLNVSPSVPTIKNNKISNDQNNQE